MHNKLVIICGPTAVGKSTLAVWLAKKCNGEVVSADSRQVYKGLDVGTGKITKKEMAGIPHHLLDVASPRGQFTVAKFKQLAEKAVKDIRGRGKLPIVVGGTGLYIDTLLGRFTIPEVPPDLALRKKLEKKSAEALFAELLKLDPRRAETIDRHNPRRLIRALEIARALGAVPPREHFDILGLPAIQLQAGNVGMAGSEYRVLWVGLSLPKEELAKCITVRLFARMGEQGMIQEVRRLHKNGLSWKRLEALGLEYRYCALYLQKKLGKDEMVERLQKEICRYAKRQMTWFKRNKDIKWFLPNEATRVTSLVRTFLRN